MIYEDAVNIYNSMSSHIPCIQRKETLLVEYKKLGRGNTVMDQRIGERDVNMSYDEKMAKRFTLERQVNNAKDYEIVTFDMFTDIDYKIVTDLCDISCVI